MKQEHIDEIKAIIVLAIGMLLFASLLSYVPEDLAWFTSHPNVPPKNLIGNIGAYIAGSLNFVLGYSAYFIVLYMFFWSWNKFSSRELSFSIPKVISVVVLFCVIAALFAMAGSQENAARFNRAGVIGFLLSDFLVAYFDRIGSYIILLTLGTLSLILTGEFLVVPVAVQLFERLGEVIANAKEGKPFKEKKLEIFGLKPKINLGQNLAKIKPLKEELEEDEEYDDEEDEEEEEETEMKSEKPKIRIAQAEQEDDVDVDDEPHIVGHYTLPSLDLLEDPPNIPTSKIESTLVSGAKLLEQTLSNFGVLAKVVDIERGPAITRYELQPAPGVKVQKFTILADDIALAMKAPTVRIVAPIPGKSRVGIEVPNTDSASVYLKDVLSSSDFRNATSKITLALGKDIAGHSMIADLAEMPHLLIAGTTGSGKTVCVNGIIMSILLNASPDEVRFVMIDPKMVELSFYNDIPHLMCPTVTDSKKAANVLNWVVGEMENRYKRLSKLGVRNIQAYNAKGKRMHYIIVIIDELADLMQVAAKGVESAITRLAQLSRAVGIHLILATQRPSVNVITGVIKANFPARISFKVASKVDSRTVLDMNGAETLLGKGDMLFMQPGDAKPTRGQASYVTDSEINSVILFIKDQQAPSYDESILQQQKAGALSGTDHKDEFYDEAVKLIIETNQASVSILQRRLRLGYTRAARLIDMMEQNGIVGPYVGSKPREILVDREQWLLENMGETDDTKG